MNELRNLTKVSVKNICKNLSFYLAIPVFNIEIGVHLGQLNMLIMMNNKSRLIAHLIHENYYESINISSKSNNF
jgi:hypothetical protein